MFSCSSENEPTEHDTIESEYSLDVFLIPNDGWGYRIMKGEDLFINQPHIPAVQGNKGFDSQNKAETAGLFIINKLESGLIPPTVTREELDSLGVLN